MKYKLKEKIEILDLDKNILCKLNKNNIYIIEDIWVMKRSELKCFLDDNEINRIIVKMQLCGLDLNRKVYANK